MKNPRKQPKTARNHEIRLKIYKCWLKNPDLTQKEIGELYQKTPQTIKRIQEWGIKKFGMKFNKI